MRSLIIGLVALCTLGNFFGTTPSFAAKKFDLNAYTQYQANTYILQDWDHFFGASQAYRKFWFKDSPAPNVILLEILGLIRFCRFGDAFAILQGLEAWVNKQPNPDSKVVARLKDTKTLISALSDGKIDVRSVKNNLKESSESPTSKSVAWPMINPASVSVLPSDFLLKVVPTCE